MAVQVMSPNEGSTETCLIVKWYHKVGDSVTLGDRLCEVETDKTSFDLEAPSSGTILEILSGDGSEVPVLSTIAIIGTPGEDYAELLPGAQGKVNVPAVDTDSPASGDAAALDSHAQTHAAIPAEKRSSPRSRRLAAQHNVPLALVKGSGPDGSIVERDVLAFRQERDESQKPATGPAGAGSIGPQPSEGSASMRVIPYAGIRRAVGERMTESAFTKPAAALTLHADASALVAWRTRLQAKDQVVSYNDLLVKILSKALTEFPQMNSRLRGNEIEWLGTVNVGVAVDTEKGLFVPVIHNASEKTVAQIARESQRAIAAIKAGEATTADFAGGTVTLTNLGMYEIEQFTPIINPPECCILAVGAIVKQPIVDEHDNIVVGMVMQLTLVFDHRIVDGAPAARFLQRVKDIVEWPQDLIDA